jgi:tetratricopeptide (TPR) repeat protein
MAVTEFMRRVIWEEAGSMCANPKCRATIFDYDKKGLHVHHIIPRKDKGPDILENLILLCRKCHGKYHSGWYPYSKVQEWKKLLINFPLPNTLLNYANNPYFYKDMLEEIEIGNIHEPYRNSVQIYLRHPNPDAKIQFGIIYLYLLHRMGADDFAEKKIADIESILLEKNNDENVVRSRVRLYNLMARIKRGLGKFEEGEHYLNEVQEIFKNDHYEGQEVDYFQAKLDRIAINQQKDIYTYEDYYEARDLLDDLEENIFGKVAKTNLIGMAKVQLANYYASKKDYKKADLQMEDALNSLFDVKYERGIILRYANWGKIKTKEMQDSIRMTDKESLRNVAIDMFINSIRRGTQNGRIYPSMSIAGGSIKSSEQYIKILLTM